MKALLKRGRFTAENVHPQFAILDHLWEVTARVLFETDRPGFQTPLE